MMINDYSAEWGFILGDALDEFDNTSHSAEAQYEEEHRDLLEAMADESEMGDADYEEWFQFINEGLQAEELELWNDFWNDKERA